MRYEWELEPSETITELRGAIPLDMELRRKYTHE
jgi:hypothetical protein